MIGSTNVYINDNIFTTDEQIVGSWMGNVLYRKCYTGSVSGGSSTAINAFTWPSNQTLIKMDTTVTIQTSPTITMCNGDYMHAGIKSGYVFVRQDYTSGTTTIPYKIIAYYTKS